MADVTRKKASPRMRRGENVPGGSERSARLRELRIAAGLTQVDLAKPMGVDRSVISQMEKGYNIISSEQAVDGLARAFDLSVQTMSAFLRGEITTADALARRGEATVPVDDGKRSPQLGDRDEWEALLPVAQAAAAELYGSFSPETWKAVATVRDSPPFPRPLHAVFLAKLANALHLADRQPQTVIVVQRPALVPEE